MTTTSPKDVSASGTKLALWAFTIALILLAAYSRSFSGPFIFDDVHSIGENPTIRSFGTAFFPPANSGITVSGRPVLNFTFALNHAISGDRVWSYHLFNLLLHTAATLALFGVVRRTLLQKVLRPQFGAKATVLAAAVAVLWGVHPLQTESVTYIVQRAEALVGLYYLLTLYGFISGTEEPASRIWLGLSVACGFLGMASKEIMISAPLMVLLYDRTFVAQEFRAAWRLRWRYYLALASSWILLAVLVWQTGNRGGTAGLVRNMPWWAYGRTQCEAVIHYLSLAVLPYPLTFDYGTYLAPHWSGVWLQIVLLMILITAALVAFRRKQGVAFPLLWFFAILAPTSSLIPVASQTMAEHRMYLPLAGVLVVIVFAMERSLGRKSLVIFALVSVVFAAMTMHRNSDYQSEMSIWRATVFSRPENPRAWKNLGGICEREGNTAEAITCFEAALRLDPNSAETHGSLGSNLAKTGFFDAGIAHFQEALRLNPGYADAHINWGLALLLQQKTTEAISHFESAVKIKPLNAEAHRALGTALLAADRKPEADACFEEATRLDPNNHQAPKFFRNTPNAQKPE